MEEMITLLWKYGIDYDGFSDSVGAVSTLTISCFKSLSDTELIEVPCAQKIVDIVYCSY